jgi:hypothetical protein
MNKALLKEIVSHVYANFAVIPSNFVNLNKTSSLMEPKYLLKEKLTFEVDNSSHYGQMWGCQMAVSQMEIKVLLGNCTLDKEFPECSMIIQPKNAPTYGLYLIYNESFLESEDSQPMIAVSPDDGKGWIECNTGLQATFLAAMEQARDLHMTWKICSDYDNLYRAMISFLKFHLEIYGE